MNVSLSIASVVDDYPDFQVAVVLACGLKIVESRPDALAAIVADREEQCRAQFVDMPLSEIPGIAAWRRAYRQFGVKKTSYRSSVERLVKNVQAGRGIPKINSFVDSYNAVSLAHVLPVGADDVDKIDHRIAFRYAQSDDTFIALGDAGKTNDPPKSGEVVLAAGSNVLCRRWNWYQDARSAIAHTSTCALLTIQSNGANDVRAAAEDLVDLLGRFNSARCSIAIATAAEPVVDLSIA